MNPQCDISIWYCSDSPNPISRYQWVMRTAITTTWEKYATQAYVENGTHSMLGMCMDASHGDVVYTILGAACLDTGRIEISLISLKESVDRIFMKGHINFTSGVLTLNIKGQFEDIVFIKGLDDEQEGELFVGSFNGLAFPHPFFRDFMLPTNPIQWVLVRFADKLMISGLFDDAGDVQGSDGILCYALSGTITPTKQFELKKVYQPTRETSGIEVNYNGTWIQQTNGLGCKTLRLQGRWENTTSGGAGFFVAGQQNLPSKGTSGAAIVFCEACNRWLSPSESFWDDPDGDLQCDSCFASFADRAGSLDDDTDALLTKVRQYHPQSIKFPTIVSVESNIAKFVQNCFYTFRNRPLLMMHNNDTAGFVRTYKYGEIEQLSRNLLLSQSLMDLISPGKHVMVIGTSLSLWYCVATLSVLIRDAVLIAPPIDTSEDALLELFRNRVISVCLIAGTDETLAEVSKIERHSSCPVYLVSRLCGEAVDLSDPNELSLSCSNTTDAANTDAKAVLFTSGSSGFSRGVLFSEELMKPQEKAATCHPFRMLDFQPFDPTYVLSLLQTMLSGGSRQVSSGTTERLLEEIKHLAPTHIGAPPSLWAQFYKLYRCGTSEREIKKLLGPRLQVASTGGAHCPNELLTFCNQKLKIGLVALYSSRETGGISRNNIVFPGVEIYIRKLEEDPHNASRDICDTTLTEKGEIGEICVSSPRLVTGYSDSAENSKKFMTINGKVFYRTGDIGELRLEASEHIKQRKLVVFGRLERMQKNSSGIWTDPLRAIETAAESCSFVQHAFAFKYESEKSSSNIDCSSSSNNIYLVIRHVCVPTSLDDIDTGDQDSFDVSNLWQKLRRFFALNKLEPSSIPTHFLVLPSSSEIFEDLITGNGKRKNALVPHRFLPILHSFKPISEITSGDTVENQNISLVKELLPRHIIDVISSVPKDQYISDTFINSSMAACGLDSLSATSILLFLKKKCSVELSPSQLFSMSLREFIEIVSVGAEDNGTILKSCEAEFDWNEEIRSVLSELDHLPKQTATLLEYDEFQSSHKRHILLIGATGFLGPVLLCRLIKRIIESEISLLERGSLDKSQDFSTHVTCIARGPNVRERILDAVALCRDLEVVSDAALIPMINLFMEKNLSFIAGDVAKPKLGLTEDEYSSLLTSVTDVVHNASVVSYLLPYTAMKNTNVRGTLSVIEFCRACKFRHVSLTYVSSTGALASYGHNTLESDVYKFSAHDFAQKKEAYAQTKAMAELLLMSANLPVLNIVRPSAISSHSLTGFTNISDWTVLLAMTCKHVVKGTVKGANVMLNCVPVDFVCDVLSSIVLFEFKFNADAANTKQFNITQLGPSVSSFISSSSLRVPEIEIANWRMRLQNATLDKYDSTPFATSFPTTDIQFLAARKKFLSALMALDDWLMKYPFTVSGSQNSVACTASTENLLSKLAGLGVASPPSASISSASVALMNLFLDSYFGCML